MKTETRAYIALAIVSVFWGTTYLALRIGVKDFPPFLFSAIRQVSAGILLFILMYFFKKLERLSMRAILRQCVPGILMITFGNGIIGWAELYIPSGLAALIVSVMPVYIVIINLFSGPVGKFNLRVTAGFVLGCTGILLIFRDNLSDLSKPDYLYGVLASFGACFFWAVGSIYMKKNSFTTNGYSNAAIQFTSGGVGLVVFSLLFDDYSQLSHVSAASLWALVYLTIVGSLLAYMCYLYTIRHLPLAVASTYAYVNPVIAILLGVVLLNEQMTWITVFALVATLYGVYLINSAHRESAGA